MINLSDFSMVKKIIEEIGSEDEKSRRALSLKRHDIYRDGGKRFLIEQIEREFSRDAIAEMRLAPINLLKKIVNKRSSIYKKPPIRITELESDQALVDFYTKEMGLNEVMAKANRYFNLFSNTCLYPIVSSGMINVKVIPSYLYSIVPNKLDKTEVDVWVFNTFSEEQTIFQGRSDQKSATGSEGFSREKSTATKNDLVASNEFQSIDQRSFIFWSKHFHFVTDSAGNIMQLSPDIENPLMNHFGIDPIVNLTKDRDNEPWAKQGEDLIDLTMAIQSGWSDLLSIAKEQGFSLLTIKSEEEPSKMTIGLNRAVWLKLKPGAETPEIGYVSAQSNLQDYKEMLMDLLGLLLTTNDMSSGEVGGQASAKSFNSGFQALIEMSSTLEAIENDKPFLRNAELELWDKIKIIHNILHDTQALSDKAKAFGKFSEDFEVEIIYSDIKPIESEQEIQKMVLERMRAGLMTRRQALIKLNPDIPSNEIDTSLKEIDAEMKSSIADLGIKDDEDMEENEPI